MYTPEHQWNKPNSIHYPVNELYSQLHSNDLNADSKEIVRLWKEQKINNKNMNT